MNDFSVIGKLAKSGRAAFRTREVSAFIGNYGYARLLLSRLKKKGKLVSVRNGWWAFPDALGEAVACEISKPCFVSFLSALQLHGLTTQSSLEIQLAVCRKPKNYLLPAARVREFRVDRKRFNNFSVLGNVFLASPEKAFADCCNAPRTCPRAVLLEALASGKLDLKLVKRFVSRMGLKRLLELVKIVGTQRFG